MGAGIAYVTAKAGIPWCCSTATWQPPTRARRIPTISMTKAIKGAGASPEQKEALLSLITPTADYADLADCDLVIEAVFEDSDVKKTVTEKRRGGAEGRRDLRLQHLDHPDHRSLAKNFGDGRSTSSASISSRRSTA